MPVQLGSVQTSEEQAAKIAFFLSVIRKHSHLESAKELELLADLEREVLALAASLQPTKIK